MASLFGLRRFIRAGLLLREVRKLRQAMERIADALELQNAHAYPTLQPSAQADLETEVTYVDAQYQAALMDIEMRLTAAKGLPPTEDEILATFELEYGRQTPSGASDA